MIFAGSLHQLCFSCDIYFGALECIMGSALQYVLLAGHSRLAAAADNSRH